MSQPPTHPIQLSIQDVFYWTITQQHPQMVVYMLNVYEQELKDHIKKGLVISCGNSGISTTVSLLEHVDLGPFKSDDEIINSCIMNKNYDLLKKLLELGFCPSKDSFTLASLYGALNIFELLYSQFPQVVLDYHCMLLACQKGFMDVVKFLNDKTSLKCNNDSLNICIIHGHLDLIKYHHLELKIAAQDTTVALVKKQNNSIIIQFYVDYLRQV